MSPLRVPLFAIPLVFVGCASLHPRAQLQGVDFQPFAELSEADLARARLKATLKSELGALEDNDGLVALAPDIKVLERTLPKGVEISGSVLSASPESGFTALGQLIVAGSTANPFGFSDYDGVGRKVLCYPQVPLVWVTGLIWGLVPLNYPCWGEPLKREQGMGLLRAAVRAAGADVIILMETVSDEKTFSRARGFLLKRLEAKPPDKDATRI